MSILERRGLIEPREIGADHPRRDGAAKVRGLAPYAAEHRPEHPAYAHLVQSTVARGRVTSIDTAAAAGVPGVLAILTHENTERLSSDEDKVLWVLQSSDVSFRGEIVAVVVADTSRAAREAAARIELTYDARPPDVVMDESRSDVYRPEQVNPFYETDRVQGDPDALLASAPHTLDATYRTPLQQHCALEPHTAVAHWDQQTERLTVHNSTQWPFGERQALSGLFGLDEDRITIVTPFIGGGFGSKGLNAHLAVACLAARAVPGRSVVLSLTRRSTFELGGHRPASVSRVQLAAEANGRLLAITHDVFAPTARLKEFAEQTAVGTRSMYAADARRTTHRLVGLDLPVGLTMRAPGETPGFFATESALDELAGELGIDPVELRIRNEPDADPETGRPFSSRALVDCLRAGAERFGWYDRDRRPGPHLHGRSYIGSGMASSVYPTYRFPGSEALVEVLAGDRYRVSIGAVDLGTGTWTTLAQIAADALDVPLERVQLQIGDTTLPPATVAGGSSGINSWGTAVLAAADALRDEHGTTPPAGAVGRGGSPPVPDTHAMFAYGAHFVEVGVDRYTGEVRVTEMHGTFAAGRIVNPRTARSQFIGGMTMGLSMALHEGAIVDPRTGQIINRDLAGYHVATHADVPDIDVAWVSEEDPLVNPMGTKGIGEIGIVGVAAAVANAVCHATGIRIRDLPISPDRLIEAGL